MSYITFNKSYILFLIIIIIIPTFCAQKYCFGGEDAELAIADSIETTTSRIFRFAQSNTYTTQGTKAVYSVRGSPYIIPSPFLSEYFYKEYFPYYKQITPKYKGDGSYTQDYKLLFGSSSRLFTRTFGKDWSGYDYLWFDARTNEPGLVIKVQIEDREIEPPVVGKFVLPDSGQWYTLQLDMRQAAQVRGIDLNNMVSIQVTYTKGNFNKDYITSMHADNFRLVTNDETSNFTVLTNQMSFALPSLPAKAPAPHYDIEPDTNALSSIETVHYQRSLGNCYLNPSGFITAFDKNHIAIAYTIPYNSSNGNWPVYNTYTIDGGAIWANIDSLAGFWTHNCRAFDLPNNSAFTYSTLGCNGAGANSWIPKQFVHKIDFKGSQGWSHDSLPICIDSDRHSCGPTGGFCIDRGGRWWVVFGPRTRFRDETIYADSARTINARFSDDLGKTWHSWRVAEGKSAIITGVTVAGAGAREFGRPFIVPYGDHVAVFFMVPPYMSWQRGLWWTIFNGTEWSTPELINGNAGDGGGSYYSNSAVSFNNQSEIFLTVLGINGVLHWNGSTWSNELTNADQLGFLSNIGQGVALVTFGNNVPNTFRAYTNYTGTIKLYRWDWNARQWGASEDISGGDIPLSACGRVPNVYVPISCPRNMLLVGWNEDSTKIKIVKIPYDGGNPTTGIKEQQKAKLVSTTIRLNLNIPFAERKVCFLIDRAENKRAEIEIFDIKGRKAIALWKGSLSDNMTISWDGKDDRGKNASQGIYVARLKVGQRIFASSFSIIK
ncbi:MAG: hypothetical protein A2487_21190 [Candidatus Raymondbacteria bacterium RifOxyC12_full_50_8]|uniref:FlgD Ig-like domain-containing protein n=1 Tax=Candidatus Raymondbacteria bacterium RIFOXYD12_FULL_49_13 TaxID=1817890 RepID=A0A1F7FJV8_UNCRA|nr:MAG: hypothetical protein A2248_09305 [Candidatus Raymondbacteria bacterium RIFOXYA2_FULL_49_16]OGJ94801.1 MAG: hypothetical protein A2487_21190 [Candidatus Raymondbacteria bacterium RifOxyC12_full_50_8]OGJ96372.1 MAG: hypothetical protein A2453_08590 [Candidatus Raymondbacteria bacterium RIFOXYC2_FULL_50_21]OGK03824.1 MAG: hypothetical protein A2350_02920 [Candidatus Raymondbacteria bacterium RifOxyB12_full_50_8]OGK06908.1 MAG: hypothetical protein A2519_11655 [Candidatus Raymondbacteria ba